MEAYNTAVQARATAGCLMYMQLCPYNQAVPCSVVCCECVAETGIQAHKHTQTHWHLLLLLLLLCAAPLAALPSVTRASIQA
jgi:hypothetical protein